MKIKRLQIQNFRGLLEESLEFGDGITVFAGRNGGGKSSALEAIAIMLSWLPVRISSLCSPSRQILPSDITIGKKFSRLIMTLSRRQGEDITLTLMKRAPDYSNGDKLRSDMSEAHKYGERMRVLLDSPEGMSIDIPVFAYYGADRNTVGECSPRPSMGTDRTSIYDSAFDAGTNFQKFAKWFCFALEGRERELIAISGAPRRQANRMRDEMDRHYSAIFAVKKALSAFSDSFRNFHSLNGKLFIGENNIPVENLSDGEKTVIALVADIAMRMAVANPRKKNPLETSAIILIDELELHLHPAWQTSLAEKIQRIFSNAQFVISSHSPSIMAATTNLYKLNGGAAEIRAEKIESPYGRAPSDVLSTVLDAGRTSDMAKKISDMYSAIDNGDANKGWKIISELNNAIPDDPDVIRGEYLLRALTSNSKK